jgi:hypothetical protein
MRHICLTYECSVWVRSSLSLNDCVCGCMQAMHACIIICGLELSNSPHRYPFLANQVKKVPGVSAVGHLNCITLASQLRACSISWRTGSKAIQQDKYSKYFHQFTGYKFAKCALLVLAACSNGLKPTENPFRLQNERWNFTYLLFQHVIIILRLFCRWTWRKD